MKKILIIGSPGSGKSTLSRKLREKLNLNVIHLDKIFWQPNWVSIPRELFDDKVTKELQKEAWIIEGNYNRTLEYRMSFADTVIFLDYEVELCLNSWKKRVQEGIKKSDMPDYCNEEIDEEFEEFIINFKINSRPHIMKYLNDFKGNVFIFKDREEANTFINSL